MTDCAYCGEYLSVDDEWRLRPEIPPGTLETAHDFEPGEAYMHPECRREYCQEDKRGFA